MDKPVQELDTESVEAKKALDAFQRDLIKLQNKHRVIVLPAEFKFAYVPQKDVEEEGATE